MKGRWILLLAAPLLLGGAEPEEGTEVFLSVSARALLAELADSTGGALDLCLQAGVAPWPQTVFGLEGGVLIPLRIGGNKTNAGLTLQAVPSFWWRFGEPETWGYLRVGTGIAGQRQDAGDYSPAWVVTAAGGFAVAPRDLMIYFGFELAGEISVLGATVQMIGLGGFLGFRL